MKVAPFAFIKTGGADPVIPVDMFWNGAGGVNGSAVSVSDFNSSCYERFPINSISQTAEATSSMTKYTSAQTLFYPYKVGATTYAVDDSSTGLVTPQYLDLNYVRNDFGASTRNPPRISVSFFLNVSDNIQVNRDAFVLHKAGGGYLVCALRGTAGNMYVRAHADDGGTGFGSDIELTPGTTYYVTMLGLRSGTSRVRVYNLDGTQVGSDSTITSNNNSGFSHWQLGRVDGTGDFGSPNNVGTISISHLAMDHTNGIFPLGIAYSSSDYPSVPAFDDSDSFDRADATDLGAGWTEQRDGIDIVSNAAQSAIFDLAALPFAYKNGTFNANQYSEIVYGPSTNGQMVGVTVRASGTDCICYVPRPSVGRSIQSVVSGTATNLTAVANTTWAEGDVVRLIAVGNFIGLYRNGTLVGSTWLNGTHATGNPGIMLGKSGSGATAGRATSWAGGNYVD